MRRLNALAGFLAVALIASRGSAFSEHADGTPAPTATTATAPDPASASTQVAATSVASATRTVPPRQGATATAPKRPTGIRHGTPTALPRRDGTLRLAVYNVENLFDDVDDPNLTGEFDDIRMTTTDARCTALAAAIRAVDADVLALAEVESDAALRWFRDRYLQGMGYDHIASLDVGYMRGVEQSVLSRHPIVRAMVWPDADLAAMQPKRTGDGWSTPVEGSGTRFQRSPLFVQVRTPEGYVLDMLVVHHKAGGKPFAFQREMEALQTIALVKERLAEDPHANIAVLGDFNAAPSEKSVKVYLDPAFGGLKNAWEQRFDRNAPRDTFVTHASGRVIDYMFVSDGLWDDLVPRSFFVFATLAPADGWDWRTDEHPPGYASDHRPLVVDLVPKDEPSQRAGDGVSRLWSGAPRSESPPAGTGPSAPTAPNTPSVPAAPAGVAPPAAPAAPATPAAPSRAGE